MLEQEIVFSEERNSWNLIVNGEWYAEAKISEFGSQKAYEQMEEMYENNLQCELEAESYDPDQVQIEIIQKKCNYAKQPLWKYHKGCSFEKEILVTEAET